MSFNSHFISNWHHLKSYGGFQRNRIEDHCPQWKSKCFRKHHYGARSQDQMQGQGKSSQIPSAEDGVKHRGTTFTTPKRRSGRVTEGVDEVLSEKRHWTEMEWYWTNTQLREGGPTNTFYKQGNWGPERSRSWWEREPGEKNRQHKVRPTSQGGPASLPPVQRPRLLCGWFLLVPPNFKKCQVSVYRPAKYFCT